MTLPEQKSKILGENDEDLFETPQDEQLDDLPEPEEQTDDTPTETAAPAKQTAPASGDSDDDIPEPLRGKSPRELARMYAEAQKAIGRQGQELGELRGLADTFIKRELAERGAKKPAKPQPKPVEDVDFFANPKQAIERAVAEHPEVRKLREENERVRTGAEMARRQTAEKQFSERHPDAAEILGNENFRAWVGKSKVRMALLRRAHEAYDIDAAEEVFGTWKELNPPAKVAEDRAAAQAARATVKRAAKVPTGGSATPKENGGGKVYRRADIIKLQLNDPDRYEAMADEIESAYREGRVR